MPAIARTTRGMPQDGAAPALDALLERITDGVAAIDPAWRITYVNGAGARLLARRGPELVGRPLWDALPALDDAPFGALLREAMRSGVAATHTAHCPALDVVVEVHAYPDAGGLSVVFRDVTARRVTEAAEREHAERLGYALEGAQDGLWDWQVVSGAVYFSPSWCRMLGYEPSEIAPHISSWTSMAHPDDLPTAMAALDEHFAGRTAQYECEHRIRRQDGSWAWILARGKVVARGADGTPRRMVGTHTDVSERKRTEAVLRAMAEASGTALGSDALLADLVARLAQALDVRMAFVAEIDGTTVRTLAGWRDGAPVAPFDYPLPHSACSAVVAQGHELHVPFGFATAFPLAPPVLGAPAESYAGVPLRDGGSGPGVRGVLCVVHSEELPASPALTSLLHTFAARAEGELIRRRREAELRERSAELARSQRMARLGSWSWVPGSDTVVWSDEQFRLYGQARGGFVPTFEGWLTLVHPDDRARVEASLAAAIGERRAQVQHEFRIVRPDGSIACISAFAELQFGDDGRPVLAIGTDQDVSERRHLESQLRQSQKMEAVGLLAGGVAHDFNNLLTVIRGNADFLLAALPDSTQSWTDAEEIRAAADRAAALTRQLLAFSRRQVLQPRVVVVDDIVAGVERLLRRVIGEDIRLDVRLAARPAPVLADPGQLEQVLLNLAVNARDAMPEGGTLAIATRIAPRRTPLPRPVEAPHGLVLVEVRDTGTGMDEATMARAFEPFFTTKEAGHGTGLGLATVFGIVEQSGGTVWLDSAPGRGTTVTVALPVADAAAAQPPRTGDGEGPRGDGLVLVVEDDDAVRSLARRTLVRAGYGVVEARTGREALRLWDAQGEQLPQALVTDVVMPDMGGRALAQALRERDPGLPILFLSGYAGTDASPRDVGGAAAFVQKPFATEALLAALAELLQAAAR